jgi:pyruvate/2-oxoglutarate dehydrogenase complex dihydrolipoamide acyltransferase (E2) component
MHPVHIPHEQVNDESVLLVDWLVADGGEVKPGQSIAIIETSKATADMEAPQGGYLRHSAAKGTEVPVGAIFCYIASSATEVIPAEAAPASPGGGTLLTASAAGAPAASPRDGATSETPGAAPSPTEPGTHFSRRALELIDQHGISRDLFKGKGLIREADVLAVVHAGKPGTGATEESSRPIKRSVPDISGPIPAAGVPLRTEELPRMKRIEAKYLASGRDHTLSSSVTVICPTAGLKAAVKLLPELGGNAAAIILYETARLLRKYPMFNAFFDQGRINYYEQVNIGLAVDAGRGLKVPVIANTDKKGLVEIAEEVEGFLLDYLNDQLPVASLAGGTFTITDLSSEEAFLFQPLVNQGQAAILGVAAEYFPADSKAGFFNLILSFDHQLTEGRVAAIFLRELRERINSYEQALRSSGKTPAAKLACSRCLRSASELIRRKTPLLEEVRDDGEKTYICRDCLMGE